MNARAAAIRLTVRLNVIFRVALPPALSVAVIVRTWVPERSGSHTLDRLTVFWAPLVAV